MLSVKVIGAGLAGCEAAWQLAKRGIHVKLYEMKSKTPTPAQHSQDFAELVCTNSLRSNQLTNAVGVLKEELRRLDSVIMRFADLHQVPAGGALAVDRDGFSSAITEFIKAHPLITVVEDEVTSLDEDDYTIVATGPLTSDGLAKFIRERFESDSLYFYDAAAPIIEKDSIDFTKAYYKSRYDKGNAEDYINCPMTKEEFENFYHELINAQTVELKSFEKEIFFEGCMPFEVMAQRGPKTLTFGPMKPVGLAKDLNGPRPYAVVQLRQDNAAASLYNIVGFQTHLTWPEQARIIRMIPGLENARFVRYGVMHRNTFMKSPLLLNQNYQSKQFPKWYFSGQMTGVEGYVESCSSGCVAAISLAHQLLKGETLKFPNDTVIGSLSWYVSHANPDNFQPMNANFGIVQFTPEGKKDERKQQTADNALAKLEQFKQQYHV